MIMTLFGALSAGTKTYLLCRSDRQFGFVDVLLFDGGLKIKVKV